MPTTPPTAIATAPPTPTLPLPNLPTPQTPTQQPPLPQPTPLPPTPLDRKLTSLTAQIATLTAQIASTRAEIDAITPQLKNPNAAQTVAAHIKLLHAYNEMRDVGQGLLGMVAESRGVRARDVYAEMGVEVGD